jgi:hypothetical protein
VAKIVGRKTCIGCRDYRHTLTAEQTHFLTAARSGWRSMALSSPFLWSNTMRLFSTINNGKRRLDDAEEPAGLDDADELPLSPEEDTSVIPDDERVLDVPS